MSRIIFMMVLLLSLPAGLGASDLNQTGSVDASGYYEAGSSTLSNSISGNAATASDLSCINCIGATEIEDVYLLNTGDTAIGNYTFDTDTLHIDSTNNVVSIGSASPNILFKLDVAGDIRINDDQPKLTLRESDVGREWDIEVSGRNFQIQDLWTTATPFFIEQGHSSTLLYLDNQSRVGIGTIAPDGTLHVHTATAGTITPVDWADDMIVENNNGGGMSILTPNSNSAYVVFGDPDDADAGAIIYDHSADDLSFKTNGTVDRLVVDGQGNVGIGTDSPAVPLAVDTGNSNGLQLSYSSAGFTTADGFTIAHSAGDIYLNQRENANMHFATNNSVAMTVLSSGNIGIGTDNPSYQLHVNNTQDASTVIQVENRDGSGTSAVAHLQAWGDSDKRATLLQHGSGRTVSRWGETLGGWSELLSVNADGLAIGTSGSFPLVLGTAGSRAIYIDTSQKVGIGTDSPGEMLHIGSTNTGATVRLEALAGTSNAYVFDNTNGNYLNITSLKSGASPFVIDKEGLVGIGTASPGADLDVTNTTPTIRISSTNQLSSPNWDGVTVGDLDFYTGDNSASGVTARIRAVSEDSAGNHPLTALAFWTGRSTSMAETVRIDSSGQVGIGTENPAQLLHLNSSGDTYMRISNAGGDSQSAIQMLEASDTAGMEIIYNASGIGRMHIREYEGANILTVDRSGTVGIGTNNPSTTLDVNGTFQASNAYFHAYDNTGGTTISTTWTSIPLDTEVREDSLYTHETTGDNANVSIGEAGWYEVTAQCTADVSGTVRYTALWRLRKNGAEIDGSRAASYHRTAGDGQDTGTISLLHEFAANDKVELQGLGDDASAITTVADGCRMTIKRV